MSIIPQLERKLNPIGYNRRMRKQKDISLSVNNYWDWLIYIDDQYLTDWEVLKFQQLLKNQLGVLVRHTVVGFGLGYLAASVIFVGRLQGGYSTRWFIKLPFAMMCMTWVSLYQSNQKVPDKYFTQLVSQPAPHGNYVRNIIKTHFPYWWSNVSKQLYDNGMNLPEMNEYDLKTQMPDSKTYFDASRY